MFFDLIKAAILGIIEGITEWLPISRTGHLILAEELIKFTHQNSAFMDMFNVVIQLGAILAVMTIYFKRLNPFQPGKSPLEVRATWQLWAKVVIAVLPSAVVGLFLDNWFEAHFYNFVSVAIMLLFYGFVFIWVENRNERGHIEPSVTQLSSMPYRTALYIGLFQLLSLMPGTSRSGSTIIGGMLVGTSRSVVTEFTFFLGIPTMFGASLLKVFKFVKDGNSLAFDQTIVLLVACVTAYVVSIYAIRFLTDYVKRHDFKIFGKYRIVLGIVLLIFAALRAIFA